MLHTRISDSTKKSARSSSCSYSRAACVFRTQIFRANVPRCTSSAHASVACRCATISQPYDTSVPRFLREPSPSRAFSNASRMAKWRDATVPYEGHEGHSCPKLPYRITSLPTCNSQRTPSYNPLALWTRTSGCRQHGHCELPAITAPRTRVYSLPYSLVLTYLALWPLEIYTRCDVRERGAATPPFRLHGCVGACAFDQSPRRILPERKCNGTFSRKFLIRENRTLCTCDKAILSRSNSRSRNCTRNFETRRIMRCLIFDNNILHHWRCVL